MDGFDPHDPSSRSTPDSTDFEKVDKEDLMMDEEAVDAALRIPTAASNDDVGGSGDHPDSSTNYPTEVESCF